MSDYKNVPLGIDDAKKLVDGNSIVIESVDGTRIKIDTTLDPDVEE